MRLALHACCGPCLLEPYDRFTSTAEHVAVVYLNPNIQPLAEYERRRDTLFAYTQASGIDAVELEYRPADWLESVGPLARDKQARCRACYRLRLGAVAQWAADNRYDALSTTLTVSPYQDIGAIFEEGERAAQAVGIGFQAVDFRDRYREATTRSRELGMYRQNYCGCLMSDVEASEQRAARKRAKKSDRAG